MQPQSLVLEIQNIHGLTKRTVKQDFPTAASPKNYNFTIKSPPTH